MAEEHNKSEQVEVSDRGLFDFVGKKEKEEKATQEEVLVTGVEKLHVEEAPKVEEKKEGLLDKLHRSNSSSSSSSSDEEEGPDGEKKKKKKKGLKENIKEKLHGDKKEAEEEKIATVVMTEQDVVVAAPLAQPAAAAAESEHTNIVVEKIDDTVKVEAAPGEDKKGFLEKIKEKLPGHHKKEAQEQVAIEETVAVGEGGEGQDGKEKKGILGKIMDKLPGYHKEETDKNTPPAGH